MNAKLSYDFTLLFIICLFCLYFQTYHYLFRSFRYCWLYYTDLLENIRENWHSDNYGTCGENGKFVSFHSPWHLLQLILKTHFAIRALVPFIAKLSRKYENALSVFGDRKTITKALLCWRLSVLYQIIMAVLFSLLFLYNYARNFLGTGKNYHNLGSQALNIFHSITIIKYYKSIKRCTFAFYLLKFIII